MSRYSNNQCNKQAHKLITNEEKERLLEFIFDKSNKLDWETINNPSKYFTLSNIYGGCYKILDESHQKRNGLYEINHMPPKFSYQKPYDKIKDGDRPAIAMIQKDHRDHVTTSHGKLMNHDFNSKQEVREYMRDEFHHSAFSDALYADLDFLLKDTESIKKYTKGCIQMIEYCNTNVNGAPCNRDCSNFM